MVSMQNLTNPVSMDKKVRRASKVEEEEEVEEEVEEDGLPAAVNVSFNNTCAAHLRKRVCLAVLSLATGCAFIAKKSMVVGPSSSWSFSPVKFPTPLIPLIPLTALTALTTLTTLTTLTNEYI